MKTKIVNLITELKTDNNKLSEKINSGTLSEYGHTVAVHSYNLTLDFIKKLEKLE